MKWMQKAVWGALLCVGLSLAFGPQPGHAQSSEVVHIVRPGENLSSIAARYNISYVQLARHNRISDPNRLRVGQRLRIPTSARPIATRPVPVAPTATRTRAPAPIATRRASRTPAQPSATPVTTRRPTRTPATATRPAPVRVPAVGRGEFVYQVRGGDTLSGIAARFGVPVRAVMARNNLPSSVIYVGQRLIIPIGGSVRATATRRSAATRTPRATATRRMTATPRMTATATRRPFRRMTPTPGSQPIQTR